MKYFLAFLIAFSVCGAMFGLCVLLQNICYKRKHFRIQGFCMPFVGLVLAIVMGILTGKVSFELRMLADFRLWLIGLATVVVSCGIVLLAKRNQESDVPLGIRCAEAAAMEIPQRVFMQTFICILLVHMGEKDWCAILINAMVWCAGILVSTLFSKEREWEKIIIEMVSSFAFSLGTGYVFFLSGCFVIPMVAHAAERFASVSLEKKLLKRNG